MKLTALLAMVLALPVLAGTADRKWTAGVTGNVNWATSPALKEVTNNKPGLGGGAHVTYKFAEKQAVRLRVDYMAWPNTVRKFSNVYTLNTKANVTVGELDYLYFVKKNWYLQAGVGETNWENQYEGRYPAYFGRKNFLQTAHVYQPVFTFGTGYVLPIKVPFVNSVAVEGRWLAKNFGERAKANSVQAGVVVSF